MTLHNFAGHILDMAGKPKQKTSTVQIDIITHNLLVAFCRSRGIKVGHFVSTLVEKAIKTSNPQ